VRITNPSRSTSFYESFSDLIFGTLIIFLVVVMALTLRLSGKRSEFIEACEEHIVLNKYTGGPLRTGWAIALCLLNDEPRVVFIPRTIWADWDFIRSEEVGGINPVRRLCQIYLDSNRGLTMIPAESFAQLDTSFSRELCNGLIINNAIGDVVNRIVATESMAGPSMRNWSVERLYRFIGGLHAGKFDGTNYGTDTFDSALEKTIRAYHKYLQGPGAPLPENDPNHSFRRFHNMFDTLRPKLESTANDAPRIQFRTQENHSFLLGKLSLTARQFREILASLSVGKGFYVEYVDESGGTQPPPEWVMEELLRPASFDKRVASAEAIRMLEHAQRD